MRRATAYGRGNWQIPGGFCEPDETLAEAAVREVNEEAGLTTEVQGLLAVRSRHGEDHSTYVVFLLRRVAGEPTPGPEVDAARFLTVEEIDELDAVPEINRAIAARALRPFARAAPARRGRVSGAGSLLALSGLAAAQLRRDVPVSWFELRSNVVNSNSCPSPAGMVPVRLLLERFSPITRLGVPLVVMPSQLLTAVLVAQSSVAVPRNPSFAASSVSQSCTKPRLSLGVVTAVPLVHVGAAGGCAGVNVVVSPSPGVMSP